MDRRRDDYGLVNATLDTAKKVLIVLEGDDRIPT